MTRVRKNIGFISKLKNLKSVALKKKIRRANREEIIVLGEFVLLNSESFLNTAKLNKFKLKIAPFLKKKQTLTKIKSFPLQNSRVIPLIITQVISKLVLD